MTKKKVTLPRSDAVVLTDLLSQVVTIGGRKMTMRQGMLLAALRRTAPNLADRPSG